MHKSQTETEAAGVGSGSGNPVGPEGPEEARVVTPDAESAPAAGAEGALTDAAHSGCAASDSARQANPTSFGAMWGGLSDGMAFPPPLPADAPLPPMPGDSAPAMPEASLSETAGRLLTDDMLQPLGLERPAPQEKEASGPASFLRQVVLGDGEEQRPDTGVAASLRETFRRLCSLVSGRAAEQPQVNPGLFAAMDAPLHGLTPDDILYANEVDAALARRPRFGVRALSVCVAVMFACLTLWAAFASVDEVTHAEGQVVGSQRTQTIQNLEGGILRAVLVHEGQIVDKDAVLAQLDNEMAESAYRDAVNKAMENSLAIVRLEAEIKGEQPVFPEHLEAWASQLIGRRVEEFAVARARQIIRDQTNLWRSRMEQLNAEIEVLQSQYTQRMHEVEEQTARKKQLDGSLALSIEQRNTAYALVQRNNFSKLEYLGMQQKVVELQGQIDALAAGIPKAQAAAEESRQRIASRRAEQAATVTDEINKRRLELNSVRESLAAGRDRVTRTELRAPVRSTVKQIYISTVGGVVKPGEPIMDLVPLDDTLLVEARVKPQDVAFLRPGQDVMVKISAYDFSIYGGLEGKLESISADTIEDKKGEHHYVVKVRTRKNAIVHHNEQLPIIPGMVVTADILIGKKTVLDYLLKPILKAKQNALRER
ncbi:HlyD family type I secretion periplasmic adaptor subunit [uncultured Desulfovibrio sp.]|uniref:HlyD family type I secretion periplasmic adaptor subunit n=1 Tax=uncultured Desulfovibrio sp. TaxID=167968 RepID=UPI002616B02F|nr:HlyD family type I secretion periplasmic adaptor subunit [uncultured Desulfovibrio sp.]